jgi:cleavage and polyadenylation specificity factor subunit 2
LESTFIDTIQQTLRNNGNVLIPTGFNKFLIKDSAGRVLELLLVLERHWRKEKSFHILILRWFSINILGNSNYGLVFLTPMSYRTIEFASHQIEWMSDIIMKGNFVIKKGFDSNRENPFKFKYIELMNNIKDLDKVQKPMVVVKFYLFF